MPRYAYQAKNSAGQLTQGEMDGGSEVEVRNRLQQMSLQPLKVVQKAAVGKKVEQKSSFFFAPKVNTKDLQIFTRQFATLINAGVPVVDALKILADGLRPGVLKEASYKIKNSIETGKRLADSMAMHPNVFDRLYCNMIQAGEEAGILDAILNRLAVYMEKSEKIKGQIKGAMVYPIIIICVALIVISGILVFIIPKFQEFFGSMGKEPPALTQMVVTLSHSMIHNWYFYLGGMIGIPILFIQYIQTPEGKDNWETFLFHAPVIGDLIQKTSFARVTRTLSTLISSGVGLIEAIEIASRTAGNIVIEKALSRSKEAVMQGKPLAQPLSKDKTFPQMVVQMISIGEQSGTLDVMLGKVADFYEDDIDTAVKALMSMIEPLLMVFLGGTIAVLMIAMYLPIFSMGDAIGGG